MAETAAALGATSAAAGYNSLHTGFIRDFYQNAHTLPTQPNCHKMTPRSHSADCLNHYGNHSSHGNRPFSHEAVQNHSCHMENLNNGFVPHNNLQETDSQGNEIFPFNRLPTDCKLKVFSCLDIVSRGHAGCVCREWNDLMMSPTVWSDLDFTTFPLCFNHQQNHVCSKVCYVQYRFRIKCFISYLAEIKPALKHLRFEYDIEDFEDGWLTDIEKVLNASYCQDLESAHLNWKDTPIRPIWIEQETPHPINCNHGNDCMHKHRHRHRTFCNFFENFINIAPNVCTLRMQFGWSMRSICNLSQLRNLHTLILEKYFVFQPFTQAVVEQLFKCTPKLRKLVLEVWTPSGQGLVKFRLNSASLQYLDLSRCRGFYIDSVNLPNLHCFFYQRHPWNGPLLAADSIDFPCLHDVLSQGAPRLHEINDHVLEDDWQTNLSDKLSEILRANCVCKVHKRGWLM